MKTIILGLLVLAFSTVSMATDTGMTDAKKKCSTVVQGNKTVFKTPAGAATTNPDGSAATGH